MMPRRSHVNKARGARNFRHAVGRTHPRNMQMSPMRGGWRL